MKYWLIPGWLPSLDLVSVLALEPVLLLVAFLLQLYHLDDGVGEAGHSDYRQIRPDADLYCVLSTQQLRPRLELQLRLFLALCEAQQEQHLRVEE